ncbi:hypothetical protein V3C99_013766, partial [Haemonchus contortus]
DEEVMQQFPLLRGCSVDLNTSHFAPILSATTNFHLEDKTSVGQPLTVGDINQNLNDQVGEYGPSKSTSQLKSPAPGSSTVMPPSLDSLKPGMRDVPAWLKSLRLHKYTAMFAELSYEEMMKLDEAELERRNVTKGARTKILQSIRKLYCRAGDLRAMHERLSLSHPQRCLRCAIATLRQMIATPMIPYTPTPGENSDCVHGFVCISYINNQNLPGLIFNLLGEIQKAVFMSGRQPIDIEYEYLLMLFSIYDKLNNNEAFTPVQKQRVHQWKRLARKAIRPADVRHQRVGLPHSGKCEVCHHKDMVHRERAKTSFKLNSGVPETSPYTHGQQQNIAAVEWSPFVQKPPHNAPSIVSKEQRRQDVSCVGLSNFFVDSFHLETPKIRPFKTISSSKPFTQSFPQYRSRPSTATGSSHAVPSLSSSSQMFGESSRWPRSIYENHQFLFHGDFAFDTIQVPNQVTTSAASNWVPSSAMSSVTERGCESTSGYSSSTSERSSGAGSPRACAPGQTLYDRVCRDVAALQLSI